MYFRAFRAKSKQASSPLCRSRCGTPGIFRSAHGEHGTAMVEFAIALPLLILLIVTVCDMGRMLNSYMILVQVTGEGVRAASEWAGLEQGSKDQFCNLTDQNGYPGHWNAQAKVRNLVNLQGMGISNLSIASAYVRDPDPVTGDSGRTVSMSVTATYNGIMPFFRHVRLSAQRSGQYLFN